MNGNLLSLATLVAFGGLLVGCSSQPDHHADSIRRVLEQDQQLSASIQTEIGLVDQFWSPSGSVSKYVAGLRQIDLSDCPPDFELAFIQHIQAWEAMQREVDNNTGLNGFINGYFGGGPSVLGSMNATESAERRLQESWFEVERVALKYGVRLGDLEMAATDH
jgi:hypothetical protein